MYNRAFPVGNALFFFAGDMMSLLCLPRGKLAFAQRGLRQQMEGRCPDKRYPNKITWKTRKSLRSEVPDGQDIFKN